MKHSLATKFKPANIKLRGDKAIWILLILLSIISAVEVFSAVASEVYFDKNAQTPTAYFVKHIIMLSFGIVVAYVFQNFKYSLLPHFLNALMILSFILVVGAFATGMYYKYAYPDPNMFKSLKMGRWIPLPAGFSFQPAEMAKFITIMWMAWKTTVFKDKLKLWETFKKIMIPVCIMCVAIGASNLSTAIIIFTTTTIVLFIAGIPKRYLAIVFSATAVLFICIMLLAKTVPGIDKVPPFGRFTTAASRTSATKTDDPTQQRHQAKLAIGNAGIIGLGVGNSVMAHNQREAQNDFVFMVITEETGLLGAISVILLFMILIYRCFYIARHSAGFFGSMLCYSIGLILTIQALIHIGVSTGLIPVTGQTLPFVSKGGTSILFACMALGVVLNVSTTYDKKEKDAVSDNNDTETADSTNTKPATAD
ncbi:MAG: FtsW/RodA/SpoVE family cell cycle protein [Bacteroidales bacterium]|jgi:cell division protein FtsW|nr:FtsW/RodA/SpoVE family cell cycle protein [Bacteroidales bacterium]